MLCSVHGSIDVSCVSMFLQIIDSGVLEDLSEDEKKLQEVGISH